MPPTAAPQSIHEYTLGTTATFAPSDRWTHSAVVGIDGYQLANVQTNLGPIASVADLARCEPRKVAAARGTIRASSVLHLATSTRTKPRRRFRRSTSSGNADGVRAGTCRSRHTATPAIDRGCHGRTTRASRPRRVARPTTHGLATGGVRLERDSRLPGKSVAALPMVGLAAVRDYDGLTIKLRGAYGEGTSAASHVRSYRVHPERVWLDDAAVARRREAGGNGKRVSTSYSVKHSRSVSRGSTSVRRD